MEWDVKCGLSRIRNHSQGREEAGAQRCGTQRELRAAGRLKIDITEGSAFFHSPAE